MPDDGNAVLVQQLRAVLDEFEAFNAQLRALNEQLRTGRSPRPQLRLVKSSDTYGEVSS